MEFYTDRFYTDKLTDIKVQNIWLWSLVRERIGEARDELMRMLAEDELREAVLLIFANKQDLPNAMNAAEITDKLGLHSLRNRNWYIQVTVNWKKSTENIHYFFSRRPAQHLGMGCMRDLTGWATSWRMRRARIETTFSSKSFIQTTHLETSRISSLKEKDLS